MESIEGFCMENDGVDDLIPISPRRLGSSSIPHRDEVRGERGPVVRGRRLTGDIGAAKIKFHSEGCDAIPIPIVPPFAAATADRPLAPRDATVALGGLGRGAGDRDDEGLLLLPRRERS